ncbi:hypothetical protein L3V79_00225 [Thiotrichales bacterium 19S9-12]|nr:hypothetical protein [Thiotrichales bacterium 19S9-11]MCF6810792.1 hypothetical protein [Thiotrichales bacterium 19S9-12]
MLQDYITKIIQASDKAQQSDFFELVLQVGIMITDDQLKKEDAFYLNLPQSFIISFSKQISKNTYQSNQMLKLHMLTLWEQVDFYLKQSILKCQYFDIKTLYLPLKIVINLYQDSLSKSKEMLNDQCLNSHNLYQKWEVLLKDKRSFHRSLNQSGINITYLYSNQSSYESRRLLCAIVKEMELNSNDLILQLKMMDQSHLTYLVYAYKSLLYPLLIAYCLNDNQTNKEEISQRIMAINKRFQSDFKDYQSFQWFYYPDIAFNKIYKDEHQPMTGSNEVAASMLE